MLCFTELTLVVDQHTRTPQHLPPRAVDAVILKRKKCQPLIIPTSLSFLLRSLTKHKLLYFVYTFRSMVRQRFFIIYTYGFLGQSPSYVYAGCLKVNLSFALLCGVFSPSGPTAVSADKCGTTSPLHSLRETSPGPPLGNVLPKLPLRGAYSARPDSRGTFRVSFEPSPRAHLTLWC